MSQVHGTMQTSKAQSISHQLSLHVDSVSDHSVGSLTATPIPITTDTAAINTCNPLHCIQKRVLFVSIIQLYRCYTKIPSFILENALFAFGIKRSWILPENKTENQEAKTKYIYHFVSNWSPEFIQIIKRKHQKGHILWIEACIDNNAEQYWSKISDKLCQIIDLSVSKVTTKTPQFNILHAHQEAKSKHLSISEQILSPITASEFTFTNYTDEECMNTDSDFEEQQDIKVDYVLADKSRPSLRDLFDGIEAHYLPLKLDRDYWINSYKADTESIFNFDAKLQDIMTQIECVETLNDLQFGALKQLFYQSNPTLIPMEFFDVKMYFEAHLKDENANKYKELLDYCNANHLYAYKKAKDSDKQCNESGSGFTFFGYESDKQSCDLIQAKSQTCDASIISVESNSLLPFRGKIGFDSSHEIQLFDSDTKRHKNDSNTNKKEEDNEEIQFMSDEELNHLEYYLSNTIVSCSRSSDLSYDHLHLNENKSGTKPQKQKQKRRKKKRNNNNKNKCGSDWNYEPPSNSIYRAKGNILITKQMTNDIIPRRIAENIVNLWQYIDKSSVLTKDLSLIINVANIKVQIMYFDFHDKESGERLYCVCDENIDKNSNHKWKMRNKLYAASEINTEFIEMKYNENNLKLPQSIRESVAWQKELQKEDKIRNFILNEHKMHAIINKTKWNKIVTQTKHHSKKRMTFSVTCEEFVKYLESGINKEENNDNLQLVPIIMFKHNTFRMEFVWILRIDENIDIGISMIYHEQYDNDVNHAIAIEICGIHLDKTYIANQCELIGGYLVRFESIITNLHIGNPDDLLNRIKDLQKRNADLKKEKHKLTKHVTDLHHFKQKYDQLIASKSKALSTMFNHVNNV